jgi:hypothetical protein
MKTPLNLKIVDAKSKTSKTRFKKLTNPENSQNREQKTHKNANSKNHVTKTDSAPLERHEKLKKPTN